jgi:mRNA-degrading endonuclease RelE of RelBE toxin-antitoxin system
MNQINYKIRREFEKDFKRLSKKFRSLEEDFEFAKIASIEPYHVGILDNGVRVKKDINAIFLISNFCTEELKICKLKKFACKSLKGRGVKSGIRIIYAYYVLTNTVDFIEMYFKGESENEDRERIKQYLASARIGE